MEGARVPVESSQIILCHRLLHLAFRKAIILLIGTVVSHIEVVQACDPQLRVGCLSFLRQLEELLHLFKLLEGEIRSIGLLVLWSVQIQRPAIYRIRRNTFYFRVC